VSHVVHKTDTRAVLFQQPLPNSEAGYLNPICQLDRCKSRTGPKKNPSV
jgi:hypothetical protein